ncbi:MAG: hypothetical protein IJ035_00275 [Oscillospiraceae bacterium]|nr:hypothetical protein [Oscillospiraceae bacterium]
MIDKNLIEMLSDNLCIILEQEISAGNEVCETILGGFSNCSDNHLFVWLKYPFKTAIRNDLVGIVYRNIDDRHYWKAEYDDIENHQTLACNYEI